MNLRVALDRAISVTDKEGFDAFEHLLARRPSAELQHGGVVDVTMMVDVKFGKVIDKSGESCSPAGAPGTSAKLSRRTAHACGCLAGGGASLAEGARALPPAPQSARAPMPAEATLRS